MTKLELREYTGIKKEIDKLEEELWDLEAKATKCTSVICSEPKGSRIITDPMAEIVSSIVEHQYKINELLEKLYNKREVIENSIESLPSSYRCLIRMRYVQGFTWEKICVEISYSWKQTHRLHAKALKQIEQSDVMFK